MSNKPFIIFPEPRSSGRHKRKSRPPTYHFPEPSRQVERVGHKLEILENAFNAQDPNRVVLRNDPGSAEVEKVLVVETVGAIDEFFKALKNLEGLEWLTEFDEEEITPDDDFYVSEEERAKGLTGRLYLIMSNQQGVQQLLSMWNTYRENPTHPQFQHGKAKWKHLFNQLKDIRLWNSEDRLRETGVLEDWADRVQTQQEEIPVEIELWCRKNAPDRVRVETRVRQLVSALAGSVKSNVEIESIAYHGLLAKLPIVAVQRILESRDVELVQAQEVMFFRPVSQSLIQKVSDATSSEPAIAVENLPQGDPIAALLDGLPLENHQRLAGRIIVDDPDGWASSYLAADRLHGTAMASLIIHGELDASEPPISAPLYIRPILKSLHRGPNIYEVTPEELLPVDLIYRAVRRIFEEDNGEPAIAPQVKIINLSIGILGRTFLKFPSPLARLLDYLSCKYRVLFMVSAGNHLDDIELDKERSEGEALVGNPAELQKEVLKAIVDKSRLRRILSPAESINSLTVGAIHNDYSIFPPVSGRFNPFSINTLPSPFSAQGTGFKRAIKPELFHNGGRALYMLKPGTTHEKVTLQRVDTNCVPGQKVACPGVSFGDVSAVRNTRGTSNASALVTREAIKAFQILKDLARENGRMYNADYALLIKTLLVHSASWGESCSAIAEALGISARHELITRLIGYGKLNSDRILGCTDQRATMLGYGELQEERAHVYHVPLPPCLIGQQVKRRVTVTLSWFAPTIPSSTKYRQALLWFSPFGDTREDGNLGEQLQVNRVECDPRAVKRGTIQHEVFEGDAAVTFVPEDSLQIQVNCRPEIGRLAEPVPYALAVSLEVAPSLSLPIYEEIRAKLRTVIEVETRPV